MQEKTYQVIDAPVHGKHDGANYSLVQHTIHKLYPFL